MPAPEAPCAIGTRKPLFICPFFKKYIPAPGIFGQDDPEFFVLALKHCRTEETPDALEPFIIERIYLNFLPPEIEEYLQCPPVPYRGDIELEGVSRVLACLVQISPVPRFIPPVPLYGNTGADTGEVELERVQF